MGFWVWSFMVLGFIFQGFRCVGLVGLLAVRV